MLIKPIIYFILFIFSTSVNAMPKILVQHQRNTENLAEIQITNQTDKALLCYVAIDGYKQRFKLQARQPSQWYRATDPRFNYHNFSTWCDYLSLYPQYQ